MAVTLPHKLIKYGLIPCAYHLLGTYLSGIRVRTANQKEIFDHVGEGGKAIVALWHQRLLLTLGYVRHFKEFRPSVMISKSKDGDLISPIAERLGLNPIRGSSSRGGRAALSAMIQELSKSPGVVHVVDGPLGPKGVVKPGLIRIAQRTGAAIFPIYVSARNAWICNSWDRFMVPKPFSKISIRWGKPIHVSPNVDTASFEEARQQVEIDLREGHAEDDAAWGWPHPL